MMALMNRRRLPLVLMLLAVMSIPAVAQTPDWVKDKKAEYNQIVGMVKASLVKNGLSPVLDGEDAGTLRFTMDGSLYVMNLYNIFTMCVGAEKSAWGTLVEDYVVKVKSARKEEQAALSSMETWTGAKDRLFLKVYPTGYIQNMRDGYVGFEEIPGTLSVVVVDLPSSVTPLKPEFIEKWKKEAGEVFLSAKANTLASLKAEKTGTKDLGEGQTMSYYYDEGSVYIATLALDRDRLKAFDGAYGLFLSVPSRSIVLIQPIKDVKYIYSLALNVAYNASDFFAKASGPILPDLFWFHDGKYYPVKISKVGTQNKMEFPDELKAMMK